MSKNINVNPDHYKVAGRERQGENVVHDVEKRETARLRRSERGPSGQRSQSLPKQPRQPRAKKG